MKTELPIDKLYKRLAEWEFQLENQRFLNIANKSLEERIKMKVELYRLQANIEDIKTSIIDERARMKNPEYLKVIGAI